MLASTQWYLKGILNGLQNPMLDPLEYVGLGNVGIASVKKIELGDGARAWKWSVRLSTAQKKKVDQAREDAAIPF